MSADTQQDFEAEGNWKGGATRASSRWRGTNTDEVRDASEKISQGFSKMHQVRLVHVRGQRNWEASSSDDLDKAFGNPSFKARQVRGDWRSMVSRHLHVCGL